MTEKTSRKPKRPNSGGLEKSAGTTENEPTSKPRDTKIGQVIALLERETGASLDEMAKATGWQTHTTRAALTGLRKKGHTIERGKIDGATRYRLTRSAGS